MNKRKDIVAEKLREDPLPPIFESSSFHCLNDLLALQAEHVPDAVAIAAPGRVPLTYAGLRRHVEDTVRRLNDLGVGRNDRVAIVLPNGPEMASAFLGVTAGATAAPLNPAYQRSELDFYLGDLEAKALIMQAKDESPARSAAHRRAIPLIELSPIPDGEAGLFDLSRGRTPRQKSATRLSAGFAQPEDTALVLHTSGTTSRPKIVPLTQTNICASARNIGTTLQLSPQDRCLNVMPLFHIHGLMAALLASLAAGASVVCTPGFFAPRFFSWMRESSPTWYTAVPTMHQAILSRAEANRAIVKACPLLRFVRSSSAALPPTVIAELEKAFGAPVIESYGMTEAAHQMASNPLPPRPRKPGSVGLAAGPEIAIMDEAGRLLSSGQSGEIVIRGDNVTPGYEGNPQANASAFTNGWFRTGDQGYMDNEGYLFIAGRIKEIINRGGEKISPREVDEVLLNHPAVAQAVAFAVPHARLGEDVAAAVVLKTDATATERQLQRFAAARLADFKVPHRIVLLDEIPKGLTGKVQRIGLAEKLGLTAGQARLRARPEFVAPRTPVEKALAEIWAQVLGVERVGVHDDFFELGGDSMLATQIVSRVRTAMRVELAPLSFFETPAIADLAATVTDQIEEAEREEMAQILAELEELSEEEAEHLLALDENTVSRDER